MVYTHCIHKLYTQTFSQDKIDLANLCELCHFAWKYFLTKTLSIGISKWAKLNSNICKKYPMWKYLGTQQLITNEKKTDTLYKATTSWTITLFRLTVCLIISDDMQSFQLNFNKFANVMECVASFAQCCLSRDLFLERNIAEEIWDRFSIMCTSDSFCHHHGYVNHLQRNKLSRCNNYKPQPELSIMSNKT